MSDAREAFERWVSSPPYELNVDRLPMDGLWPGQYRDHKTEVAWLAWQETARQIAAELRDCERGARAADHDPFTDVPPGFYERQDSKVEAFSEAVEIAERIGGLKP